MNMRETTVAKTDDDLALLSALIDTCVSNQYTWTFSSLPASKESVLCVYPIDTQQALTQVERVMTRCILIYYHSPHCTAAQSPLCMSRTTNQRILHLPSLHTELVKRLVITELCAGQVRIKITDLVPITPDTELTDLLSPKAPPAGSKRKHLGELPLGASFRFTADKIGVTYEVCSQQLQTWPNKVKIRPFWPGGYGTAFARSGSLAITEL
jgi:hypothetical protein